MIQADGRLGDWYQAPRPVTTTSVGRQGKVATVDELGGVFTPLPNQPVRVVYSFGHPDAKAKTPVFSCPVSTVPVETYELLGLWNECRLLGVLPRSGGLLDQPLIVRRAFTIFAGEWAKVDTGRAQSGAALAASLAATSVLTTIFGGRR